MNTKKEEILKALKQYGRLSTYRIIGIVGINSIYASRYLEELLKEKLITKKAETLGTFWELKK